MTTSSPSAPQIGFVGRGDSGKPFSDPEFARAASAKAAEARTRRAKLADATPDAQIEAELPRLVRELLDAALGRGDFGDLKAADRLKALQTALAYGLGRPGARQEPADAPEPPSAASLFGQPPAD